MKFRRDERGPVFVFGFQGSLWSRNCRKRVEGGETKALMSRSALHVWSSMREISVWLRL